MWLWKLQIKNNNTSTRHLLRRELIEACTESSYHPPYIMSDNKKQEKDYSKEVDALLPEAEALAKVRSSQIRIKTGLISVQGGKLQEALDKILVQEKLTRNVSFLKLT